MRTFILAAWWFAIMSPGASISVSVIGPFLHRDDCKTAAAGVDKATGNGRPRVLIDCWYGRMER